MKDIRSLGKKKISLVEIERFYKPEDYITLYKIIKQLNEEEILAPVKASTKNGKSPGLYLFYWVKKRKEDYSKFYDELNYDLTIQLDNSYYLKNIEKYQEDRDDVLLLNEYLLKDKEKLKDIVSLNERSFEIWGREKFLKQSGKRILKNLGLKETFLNYYPTTVPLAYYSHDKRTPQNVLVLENKDTFYSMRKHLIDSGKPIFDTTFFTLIYGGGKNIFQSFKDFDISVEPYIASKANEIFYLGDLDYEGIIIYESLKKAFEGQYEIQPFLAGYKSMVDKANKMEHSLPKTKQGQNRNISTVFLSEFDDKYREEILKILNSGLYIPQEILNIGDF